MQASTGKPPVSSWRSTPRGACLLLLLGFAALAAQYAYITLVAEVYPSISLPRGASVVRGDAKPSTVRWLVFAVTADDRRLRVDEQELLATVPGQYRTPILARGFGILPASKASRTQVLEAQSWLRSRLRYQLGHEDVVALELVRAVQSTPTAAPPRYRVLGMHRVEL